MLLFFLEANLQVRKEQLFLGSCCRGDELLLFHFALFRHQLSRRKAFQLRLVCDNVFQLFRFDFFGCFKLGYFECD